MKVLVVFEFENISDIESVEASAVVQSITESCETMQVGFDATNCWVQEVFGEDSNQTKDNKQIEIDNLKAELKYFYGGGK